MRKFLFTILLIALVLSPGMATSHDDHNDVYVGGSSTDDLRAQIEARNAQIKALEDEIEKYEEDLDRVSRARKSLENAVNELEIAQRKLATDLRVTENKIEHAQLSISELELQIHEQERKIKQNSEALSETLRRLDERNQKSIVEALLTHEKLSEFWASFDTLEKFQVEIKKDLSVLRDLKVTFEENQKEKINQSQHLTKLEREIAAQKVAVDSNKKEKDKLLNTTKSTESNYREILAEKQAQKEAFEEEMFDLESKLQIALDPSSVPQQGRTALVWPFDTSRYSNPHKVITQRFGGTQFAQQNPHVYGRPFHNGTDFGLHSGTKILAAANGIVAGFGNTDAIRGCYSYGKWILLKHDNGLATLYAHLSVISVSKGQRVNAGDLIGFSGNTGYSTGPHLHFTVYGAQAVQIMKLGDFKSSSTNCSGAEIPVAPHDAYFDPMSYLPQ